MGLVIRPNLHRNKVRAYLVRVGGETENVIEDRLIRMQVVP